METPNTVNELVSMNENNTTMNNNNSDKKGLSPEMEKVVNTIMDMEPSEQLNIIRGTLGVQKSFHEYVVNSDNFNELEFETQCMWIQDLRTIEHCYNMMKDI